MSLSSPSVPTVPDPNTVAKNQQDINLQTLETQQAANQVNQATPTGTLTYTQTGVGPNGVPTYTATQTLSPAEQALLTQMQGTQGVLGRQAFNLLQGANYGGGSPAPSAGGGATPIPPVMPTSGSAPPVSSAGSPAAPTGGGVQSPASVIGDATSGNTAALLKQETDYLNPEFKMQTDQLDAKLRAQGIFPGSEAYTNQMRDLQLNQNQAVTGFLATAEPQAYQQAVSSYELPLTMASTELGLSTPAGLGLTTTPQTSMQPANLEGDVSSANAANMAAYNAQLAQQNAMMSGLFGLGGAAISGGTGGFGNSLIGSLMRA